VKNEIILINKVMNKFYQFIGEGEELNPFHMAVRAVIIFLIALVLIRFSGRRTFGMLSPFDNVIGILLGAILSRAVIGASPFLSIIVAAFVIVALHRLFAWISLYSGVFGSMIKGNAKIIYKDGNIIRKNMNRFYITDKDLAEGIRLQANVESLDEIRSAYIERDGKISVIKK
jgi:uncharacterized membrane protein YcaP (DUF421 family)